MARLFLNAGDTFHGLGDAAEVFGNTGNEAISVVGSPGLTLDGNIEQVEFDGNIADYRFQIAGTETVVRDADGNLVATFIGLNQDSALVFADGSAVLSLTGLNAATLGGTGIGTAPGGTAVEPVDFNPTPIGGGDGFLLRDIEVNGPRAELVLNSHPDADGITLVDDLNGNGQADINGGHDLDVLRLIGDASVRIDFTDPLEQVEQIDLNGNGEIEIGTSEFNVRDQVNVQHFEIIDAHPRGAALLDPTNDTEGYTGNILFDGTAFGGDGVDTDGNIVLAGSGDDTIFGGVGNDFFAGGAGSNVLSGGRNADFFYIELTTFDVAFSGISDVKGGTTYDDSELQDFDWLLLEAADDQEPVTIDLSHCADCEGDCGELEDHYGADGFVATENAPAATIPLVGVSAFLEDIENVNASGNFYNFLDIETFGEAPPANLDELLFVVENNAQWNQVTQIQVNLDSLSTPLVFGGTANPVELEILLGLRDFNRDGVIDDTDRILGDRNGDGVITTDLDAGEDGVQEINELLAVLRDTAGDGNGLLAKDPEGSLRVDAVPTAQYADYFTLPYSSTALRFRDSDEDTNNGDEAIDASRRFLDSGSELSGSAEFQIPGVMTNDFDNRFLAQDAVASREGEAGGREPLFDDLYFGDFRDFTAVPAADLYRIPNLSPGVTAQMYICGSNETNVLIAGYDNDRVNGQGADDLLMGGDLEFLLTHRNNANLFDSVTGGISANAGDGLADDGRDTLIGGAGEDDIVWEADGGAYYGGAEGATDEVVDDTLWITPFSVGRLPTVKDATDGSLEDRFLLDDMAIFGRNIFTREYTGIGEEADELNALAALTADSVLRFDLGVGNGVDFQGYGGADVADTADQTNYRIGSNSIVRGLENIDASGLRAIDYLAAGDNDPELNFENQQNYRAANSAIDMRGTDTFTTSHDEDVTAFDQPDRNDNNLTTDQVMADFVLLTRDSDGHAHAPMLIAYDSGNGANTNFRLTDDLMVIDSEVATVGQNYLIGGFGDDTIEGRGGDDFLSGRQGDDLFIFSLNDGDNNNVGDADDDSDQPNQTVFGDNVNIIARFLDGSDRNDSVDVGEPDDDDDGDGIAGALNGLVDTDVATGLPLIGLDFRPELEARPGTTTNTFQISAEGGFDRVGNDFWEGLANLTIFTFDPETGISDTVVIDFGGVPNLTALTVASQIEATLRAQTGGNFNVTLAMDDLSLPDDQERDDILISADATDTSVFLFDVTANVLDTADPAVEGFAVWTGTLTTPSTDVIEDDEIVFRSYQNRLDGESVPDQDASLGREAYAEDLVVGFEDGNTKLVEGQEYRIFFDDLKDNDVVTLCINGVTFTREVGMDPVTGENIVGQSTTAFVDALIADINAYVAIDPHSDIGWLDATPWDPSAEGEHVANDAGMILRERADAADNAEHVFLTFPEVTVENRSGGDAPLVVIKDTSDTAVVLYDYDGSSGARGLNQGVGALVDRGTYELDNNPATLPHQDRFITFEDGRPEIDGLIQNRSILQTADPDGDNDDVLAGSQPLQGLDAIAFAAPGSQIEVSLYDLNGAYLAAVLEDEFDDEIGQPVSLAVHNGGFVRGDYTALHGDDLLIGSDANQGTTCNGQQPTADTNEELVGAPWMLGYTGDDRIVASGDVNPGIDVVDGGMNIVVDAAGMVLLTAGDLWQGFDANPHDGNDQGLEDGEQLLRFTDTLLFEQRNFTLPMTDGRILEEARFDMVVTGVASDGSLDGFVLVDRDPRNLVAATEEDDLVDFYNMEVVRTLNDNPSVLGIEYGDSLDLSAISDYAAGDDFDLGVRYDNRGSLGRINADINDDGAFGDAMDVADRFEAFAQGFETVFGGLGDDWFAGNAQDETFFGDAGDDTLAGGAGDDTILGQDGDDLVFGGDGDDLLFGDDGDDVISGGAGHDEIDGGSGADVLSGDEGHDLIVGGNGDDLLIGDDGDDVLEGGSGDDLLTGGLGTDLLMGGAGDDRYVFATMADSAAVSWAGRGDGDAVVIDGLDVLFFSEGNDSDEFDQISLVDLGAVMVDFVQGSYYADAFVLGDDVGDDDALVQVTNGINTMGFIVIDAFNDSNGAADFSLANFLFAGNQAPDAAATATPNPVDEGSDVILDASASFDIDGDALSFSWAQVSGPDLGLGTVSGAVNTILAPQVDADTVFGFEVTVNDGALIDTATVDLTVLNVGVLLEFIGPNGFDVVENQVLVGTVTAVDPEGDALTYRISGGDDAGLFSIGDSSGALSFTAAPDFEAPADADADNVYAVEVSVTDGVGQVSQMLSITVTDDPNEGGVGNRVSLDDLNGTALTPASFDASVDAFVLVDNVNRESFVEVTGYGEDDLIEFTNIGAANVVITPDVDTRVAVNNSGTVSDILLLGVQSGFLVQSVDAFNALPVGDVAFA